MLKDLINTLRVTTLANNLTPSQIGTATAKLQDIGYQYDSNLFPSLPNPHNWGNASTTMPQTLAEALLWKMGKWKVYQSFASHFANSHSRSSGTDVVFYAFAKHLQNRTNPIYDQHALRGLWAIDAALTSEQSKICHSVLVAKTGKWKAVASGRNTVAAYEIYVGRIRTHSSGKDRPSMEALDKLLMPLGQAIKEHTDLAAFREMCGFKVDG